MWTSGLLLVKLLQGASLRDALEHVTAAVYEIMLAPPKICRNTNCR
ncbi:pyridoxal kinase [Klebsiella pneumoniae]|uniref:Pyridoxal kinase n=1 Tax=Klebsiella pneumoniae TaxID=573 RepID=A0A377V1Y6_KLEPN|nr:pyridoxal kinase [Klebsiella pneumoniae]